MKLILYLGTNNNWNGPNLVSCNAKKPQPWDHFPLFFSLITCINFSKSNSIAPWYWHLYLGNWSTEFPLYSKNTRKSIIFPTVYDALNFSSSVALCFVPPTHPFSLDSAKNSLGDSTSYCFWSGVNITLSTLSWTLAKMIIKNGHKCNFCDLFFFSRLSSRPTFSTICADSAWALIVFNSVLLLEKCLPLINHYYPRQE